MCVCIVKIISDLLYSMLTLHLGYFVILPIIIVIVCFSESLSLGLWWNFIRIHALCVLLKNLKNYHAGNFRVSMISHEATIRFLVLNNFEYKVKFEWNRTKYIIWYIKFHSFCVSHGINTDMSNVYVIKDYKFELNWFEHWAINISIVLIYILQYFRTEYYF